MDKRVLDVSTSCIDCGRQLRRDTINRLLLEVDPWKLPTEKGLYHECFCCVECWCERRRKARIPSDVPVN